mgnify:CR=1 FL=1
MQFHTEVDIKKGEFQLTHEQNILLIGSCFADNMGSKLAAAKFNVLCNPFGTLYNPMSIAWQIERAISGKPFTTSSEEILKDGDIYHSWMHHTTFSAKTVGELIERMNVAMEHTHDALKTASTLIITFGTSIIYELKADGRLVANCHKQKDCLFTRRMLSTNEITERWTQLCKTIHGFNPKVRIIFTVSPIRHKRDGFHLNQLSKATLLLAVDKIMQNAKTKVTSEYFPSYEIMMDELRDYRFYADDMIHPSQTAIDYIWERFKTNYVSKTDEQIIKECNEIGNILAHRPSDPGSEAYMKLIQKTLDKIMQLKNKYPYIKMDSEQELCNTILKK